MDMKELAKIKGFLDQAVECVNGMMSGKMDDDEGEVKGKGPLAAMAKGKEYIAKMKKEKV